MDLEAHLSRVRDKMARLSAGSSMREKDTFPVPAPKPGQAGRSRWRSPLALAQVEGFEKQHGIELPADSRAFITRIADGGNWPFYGLVALGKYSRYLNDLDPLPTSPSRTPSPSPCSSPPRATTRSGRRSADAPGGDCGVTPGDNPYTNTRISTWAATTRRNIVSG